MDHLAGVSAVRPGTGRGFLWNLEVIIGQSLKHTLSEESFTGRDLPVWPDHRRCIWDVSQLTASDWMTRDSRGRELTGLRRWTGQQSAVMLVNRNITHTHKTRSFSHTHYGRDGNELLIMLLLDVYDQSGSETPSRAVLMCVIHRHWCMCA